MEDERGAGGHSDSGGVSGTPSSGKLADERVVENNRVEEDFEEGDGEEIMVEVVGSDVFVDGVSGNGEGDCEMAEAGELKGDVVEKEEESTNVSKEGDGNKIESRNEKRAVAEEVDTNLSMSIGTREEVSELPVGGGKGVDDEACNRGTKANVASEKVASVSAIDVSEEKESKGEVVENDVSDLVASKSDEKVDLGEEKEVLPEEKHNGNDGIIGEVDSVDASGGELPDSATQKGDSFRAEVECPSIDGDSGIQGKSVLENNASAAESKGSIPEPDAPIHVSDLQEEDVSAAESKDTIPERDAPTDVSDLQEKDVLAAESKDSIPERDAPTDVLDLQEKDVSAAESKDSIPEPNAPTCLDDVHGAKLEPNDQIDGVSHGGPKPVHQKSVDTPKQETVGNDECSKAEDGADANKSENEVITSTPIQLSDGSDAVETNKDDVGENVQNKASMSASPDEEIVLSDSGISTAVGTETRDQNVVIASVKEVDGGESVEKGMEIDESVDKVPISEAAADIVGECGSPQSTKEVVASQETEPSIHELEKTEMKSNVVPAVAANSDTAQVSIKPDGNGNTEPLPSSTDVSSLDEVGNEENRANGFHAVEAQESHTSEAKPMEIKEEGDSDQTYNVEQDIDAEIATEGPSSESENSKMSNEGRVKYTGSLRMKQSGYLTPPKEEGCFAPSDLVWGKVRSHPWWPGQIFDLKEASEKAVKHHKKDSFLVAYFGDQTFAWNDASALKPFRPYFSQIEKQSNSESFHNAVNCALEEVERRVQLGLSCSCVPKNDYAKIETQVLENTGIREESSKRYGVDQSSCASCFEPNELLEFIKNAAPCASSGADRLDIVIARAQLEAFCSFKGYGSPIEFPSSGELLENDEETEHIRKEGDQSGKERSLVELMGDGEYSLDDEDESVDHGKSPTGKKRKALDPLEGSDKRVNVSAANPKPSFKIGECIRRVANQLTGATSTPVDGTQSVYEPSEKQSMVVSAESLSVNDMLSQLELLALDPKKRHTAPNQIRAFFMGFRSSIAISRRGRKKKSEQAVGGSGEDFEFDDVNDSYWTDRIVQNNEDGSLQVIPFHVEKSVKSGRKPHSRKRFSTGNSPTQASEFDENAKRIKQESSPAELILSFAERNRIPSEISLNKMFRRFGPLMESETEVDHESGSAKVIFKRGSDAEVARNSAEKFSIFGPVLVSYQIGYSPVISVKILPVSLPSQEEAPLMI